MLALFELVRMPAAPEGAFGVLFRDGLPFALTLEHTYADPRVKIPAGLYDCRSSYFHRGGYDAYEITGVAGHTPDCSSTKGNVEDDAEGCVLLGRRPGELNGKPTILESALAFDEFMRRTAGRNGFQLHLREVPRA